MKKLLILTTLLSISLQVHSAEWVLINSNDDGKGYIDSNIQLEKLTDKTYRTAWFKAEYTTAQTLPDGKIYWQSNAHTYYDCTEQKLYFANMVLYDKKDHVVDFFGKPKPTPHSDWHHPEPNTIGKNMLNYVCSY